MRQGALATGGRNHYVGLTALDNGPIMTFPAEARLDLLCVGHLNIDHEVRVAELPKEDRTVPTLTHDIFLGGTAANVARWGARTGLRCGLAAFVGRDLPEYMRETLRHDQGSGYGTIRAWALEILDAIVTVSLIQWAVELVRDHDRPVPWLWPRVSAGPPKMEPLSP